MVVSLPGAALEQAPEGRVGAGRTEGVAHSLAEAQGAEVGQRDARALQRVQQGVGADVAEGRRVGQLPGADAVEHADEGLAHGVASRSDVTSGPGPRLRARGWVAK